MAFTFAAFCYMLTLVLCASLIFFVIWHIIAFDELRTDFKNPIDQGNPARAVSDTCAVPSGPKGMGDGKTRVWWEGRQPCPFCQSPPPANTWSGLRARVPSGGAAVARLWAVAVETRGEGPSMVTVVMGTVRRLPCRVYAAAEAAVAPPGGYVQGDGAQEGGGAPRCQLLCLPHRGLFFSLQRERLKNIERICCLLRKLVVPEYSIHGLFCLMFLCAAEWVTLGLNIPLLFYHLWRYFHRPADGSEVMYDAVSIMNADILNYCQKESWCKLAFYLLSFFYYLYSMVYTLVSF
ncbi:hypothetical protein MC885_019329 [Smutsia gigantea]|nr:hypothetical protein MC885_019329 [Smutsia gigantea]